MLKVLADKWLVRNEPKGINSTNGIRERKLYPKRSMVIIPKYIWTGNCVNPIAIKNMEIINIKSLRFRFIELKKVRDTGPDMPDTPCRHPAKVPTISANLCANLKSRTQDGLVTLNKT